MAGHQVGVIEYMSILANAFCPNERENLMNPDRKRACQKKRWNFFLAPNQARLTHLLLANGLQKKKELWILFHNSLILCVGAPGFEPGTPCSQSRCATELRYAPNMYSFLRVSIACGEGGIRTRGTPCRVRRFSKPVDSATLPLHRVYALFQKRTQR